MITSLRNVPRRTKRAQSVTIPAPVGGWNARDSLGAMDRKDAVTLTNLWPGTSSILLRKGYTEHVAGITGQIDTLMVYSSGTADMMFAIAGGSIYDVTAEGVLNAAAVTGLSNSRWQYINFTTTGGSYIVAVNGVNKAKIYDGAAWHTDGDGAPYDITAVNSATCPNITMFKNRIWLIQNNSLKVWYLPINAIGGAATGLDMSSLCKLGGYIMAAMTWTLDAGYGMDDYLVFITSNGETLVWRLTDPTSPSGIALIGIYTLGTPIGRRCWIKYGGDLLIITNDGVVALSSALQSSRVDRSAGITDKIRFAVSSAVTNHGSYFGWQLLEFPKVNQLYLNVPVLEGSKQQQYVQNNITRSWCNFTGWAANCWELLNDEPYFGGDGFVGHAWNGASDNGSDIAAFAIQSFQGYGSAVQKRCSMIRYHLRTDAPVALLGNVNADYDLTDHATELAIGRVSISLWDATL